MEPTTFTFVAAFVGLCFSLWCAYKFTKWAIRMIMKIFVPLASFVLGAVILYVVITFVL